MLLAGSLMVLLAIGTVNLVAWLAVRGSLYAAVDHQLLTIPSGRPPQVAGQPAPAPAPAPDDPAATAGSGRNDLLANLVVTRLDATTGSQLSQVVGPNQVSAPKPDLTVVRDQVAAGMVRDRLLTVPGLQDGGYQYRVRTLAPGDHTVVVIATSLAGVRSSVEQVVLVDAAVSLGVVLALLGIGFVVLRIGLRPLADVENAAERIAAGDLSVRAGHTDEGGEVGSLARSFNRMIEQIDDAFQARQASERQLRTFLADVSHELRTPLTSIRAYAELFDRGALPMPANSATALSRIGAEATRMGTLVEDLLTLARLDQHRGLQLGRVDLGPLVAQAVQDAGTAAPGHHVLLDPGSEPTATAIGDAAGLQQVVANLLSNAVRHTPAGTRITAAVRVDGEQLTVQVSDDGPGMTPEVAARAFERFYRPDPGRSRGAGGTGLGLAIVKSLVEAHHGTVDLDTAPGQGARFLVRLPATPAGPPL